MKTVMVTGALVETGQGLVYEFEDSGYFVIGTDRKNRHCGCNAFINLDARSRVLKTNLMAPFILIQDLLPCVQNARGPVINTGSVYPEWDVPGVSLYASSKSALMGMSRTLSIEWNDKLCLFTVRTSPHRTSNFSGQPELGLDKNTKATGLACTAVELAEKAQELESGDSFEVSFDAELGQVGPLHM